MNKELLNQKYEQLTRLIAKEQISVGRYQKVIKDIKDIQVMGILDAVNDEKVLEQICKYQELEYAKLNVMYRDLKELKHQKETLKAIVDAIKKVEPLDCPELFG